MANVLLIIYITVLIVFCALTVQCARQKQKWSFLYICELIAILISGLVCWFYNQLPGSGFMPGLQYIAEVVYSMGAMIVYAGMLIVDVCIRILIYLLDSYVNLK